MVIHSVGESIGTGIADLVNIFDPGVVILGGEVISHFGDHLIEGINRTVGLRGIHPITQRTRILVSKLGGLSAARGAATLMIEKYFGSEILNLGSGGGVKPPPDDRSAVERPAINPPINSPGAASRTGPRGSL